MYSYKTSNKIFKKPSNKTKSFLETINSYKGFDSQEVLKTYYNSKKNKSNKSLLYASYSASPKLYSLLDINDKKTNVRGTSLPIQYERLTDEQIKNFPLTYRNGWGKIKINIKIDSDKIEKNNENKNIIIKDNIYNNNNKINELNIRLSNNKKNISLSERNTINKKEINQTQNYNNNNLLNSFRLPQKIKIQNQNNNNTIETTKIRKKYDIYLPQGYSNHEKFVINPILFKQKISTDPFISRLPDINIKEIKQKSNETDIFHIKPQSNKDNINITKTMNYPNNMSSDIFNIKKDKNSLLKSGEKYLFKEPKISYTVSNESKSYWEPNPKIPTLFNHTSKEYNIIIPNVKNTSKTKKNILENCDLKRNVNIVNDYNPIYRQKSLSDYHNIVRVSSANVNKNYIESYKKSYNVFNRNSDICSCFDDIHKTYKNLCEKPFVNKI